MSHANKRPIRWLTHSHRLLIAEKKIDSNVDSYLYLMTIVVNMFLIGLFVIVPI